MKLLQNKEKKVNIMSQFPLKFEVQANAMHGISNPWKSFAKDFDPINVAIPVEFQGPGKTYSPHELYGLAILNCLIGIYKHLCEKNNVTFKKLEGKLTLTIDKNTENDQIILSHIDITFNITEASDKEKARDCLEKTFKICPVANSIKVGKTYHVNIN
jgi:uncharacterized OsmC-like protein